MFGGGGGSSGGFGGMFEFGSSRRPLSVLVCAFLDPSRTWLSGWLREWSYMSERLYPGSFM